MDGKQFGSKEEVLAAIADLKARWPAHSLKPTMQQQLEELEEQLLTFTNQKEQ